MPTAEPARNKTDCFVSVVAPLRNDADILADLVPDLCEVLAQQYTNYEIILVDDASSDETVTVVTELLARHEFIRLIRLSRPFGHEIAILAGLESVIGDFVVIMDPDSDPVELIPAMVDEARKGKGIVVGVREHRNDQPLMRLGAGFFYWCCNRILKLGLPVNSTDFRVLSRQVVNAITRIKDHVRYLRTYGTFVGFPSSTFTYSPKSRRGKPRRRTLLQAVALAVDVFVANSTLPLRAVSTLGLALSALSGLYGAYSLVNYLLRDDIALATAIGSLASAATILLLFLALAVLCEYVRRILGERRDRPLYYVLTEMKSSVMLDEDRLRNVVSESFDGETSL